MAPDNSTYLVAPPISPEDSIPPPPTLGRERNQPSSPRRGSGGTERQALAPLPLPSLSPSAWSSLRTTDGRAR